MISLFELPRVEFPVVLIAGVLTEVLALSVVKEAVFGVVEPIVPGADQSGEVAAQERLPLPSVVRD